MQIPSSPIDPHWTILKILQWTTAYFKTHHIDSPRLTAEILLAHTLNAERIDLYTRFDQPLTKDELAIFKALIKRRIQREPVAYITGIREFWGLEFNVTPDVLIPRPETEFLVEAALQRIPTGASSFPFQVLDVGTGSGAVIVSIAVNRPGHGYFASDISVNAIHQAAKNAHSNGVGGAIHFCAGMLFSPFSENALKFDLILSNPPYIAAPDLGALEPEVRNFEPGLALDGGPDGMGIIREMIASAPQYMNHDATLMIEIGFDQKDRVEQIINDDGRYRPVEFIKDYAEHHRVAVMHKK
ncbi:MAG: peptide chain release factor N(5)-glutamine methyltransferase [Desulfobacteraceae bacterium]|nr:MAG: peptide chain release factor N(5)-glutamine methyltransferase [Desulfobacteraceae bacterium]